MWTKRLSRRRKREDFEGWIWVSPTVLIIAAFFFIPLLVTVLRGFGLFNPFGESEFTFKHYKEIFSKPMYLDSLLYTFYVGIGTTIGSLLVSLPFCLVLRNQFAGKKIISALYKAPLVIPSLIACFMIMTIIAKGGLFNQLLMGIGFIQEPLHIVQDKAGIGIFIVEIWKNVPFMIIIILSVMQGINPELIDAAKNLGANNLQVIRKVVLPLSLPGISAASVLVFIKAFGGYVIPKLMGPIYPITLPVLMYAKAQEEFDWAMSSALATIVSVLAVGVMVIYGRLVRNSEEVLKR